MAVLVILAVLLLLAQIRVGVQVRYREEGPAVSLRLGRLHRQVFPRRKKAAQGEEGAGKPKKPKKKKKQGRKGGETEEEPQTPPSLPQRIGGALEYVQALLPVVLDMAGRFRRKLQMDTLVMELTVGGPDPAEAAMAYGRSQAVLGALWGPITEVFAVKDGHAWSRVAPDGPGMRLYLEAELSLKIGQIVCIGVFCGLRAIRAFLQVRRRRRTARKAG